MSAQRITIMVTEEEYSKLDRASCVVLVDVFVKAAALHVADELLSNSTMDERIGAIPAFMSQTSKIKRKRRR